MNGNGNSSFNALARRKRQRKHGRSLASVSGALAGLSFAIVLTGCATPRAPIPIETTPDVEEICAAVFKPIRYSPRDTLKTQDAIQDHNARRDGFCAPLKAPG